MSYCINPLCSLRPNNLVDAKTCRGCGDGLLIEGRYEILDILQSADPHPWQVFKVIDNQAQNFERFKILKTLNKYISPNPTDKEKEKLQTLERLFDREIQSLSVLRNAGIPRYEGMRFPLPSEGTRPKLDCFVMELIEGEDLGRWIASNKRLADITKARIWLKNITMILQYVHEQGYIHRDIKPTNIILKGNGKLALIDFGIVGEINSTISEKKSHTQVLDNHYAAPEQMANGSLYYIQSDFFAIGKTFVHLLTDRIPLPGRMELYEWKHDVEFIDTQSPDNGLSDNGIIPLLDWLMRADYRDRPQTSQQIIDVIDYLSKPKSDGNFPNARDTQELILGVQKTGENCPPTTTTLVSEDKPTPIVIPPVVQEKRPRLLTIISITSLSLVAMWMGIAITFKYPPFAKKEQSGSEPANTTKSTNSSLPSVPVKEVLISFGDRAIKDYLVGIDREKTEDAIKSFTKNNYSSAYAKFYALWEEQHKNLTPGKSTDPILLIYMNNAKVRYWQSKPPEKRKVQTGIQTIAVAAPMTDARGKHILYGVAHAQNKVTQNNKLPDKNIEQEPTVYLEVGIVNDENQQSQVTSIAEKLASNNITGLDRENRQILTVIGHYASELTCKALPTYAQAGLPIISPASSMEGLPANCADKYPKVFFRTVSSSKLEASKLIEILKTTGASKDLKIVAFYRKDRSGEKGYSQNIFNSFNEQYNSKLDGVDLSDENKDIEKDINEKIKDANVIILFPNGKTDDASAFKNSLLVIKKANEIQKSNPDQIKLILASNPLLSSDFPVADFNGWKGKFVIAIDWYRGCGNPDFINEQKILWGDNDLDRIIAQSYEATQVMSRLFKDNISNRSDILTKLAALEKLDPKITSHVFKDKKDITFNNTTGDRNGIENRILVTPEIVPGTQLRFTPLDNKQCR